MSLPGWDVYKKEKLTFDSSIVDADLTDFVTSVLLSTASGKTDFDHSAVFTALGANSKKIAFEIGDTGVQCYGEIVEWDHTNNFAHIEIKVPSVLAATDSFLYFYYDPAHADNTTYIGDTNSTPSDTVHSDRVFVSHQAQDPSGSAPQILDSSPNAKHGTSYGSMTSGDLIDGLVGKALDYDGSNDYTNHGYDADHDVTDKLTIRLVVKPSITLDSGLTNVLTAVSRQSDPDASEDSYLLGFNTSGRLHLGSWGGSIQSTKDSWASAETFIVVGTYNATGLTGDLFVDGLKETLTVDSFDAMAGSVNNLVIGKDTPADNFFPGIIDEVIIINDVMSDAWVKADNAALRDNLITFSNSLISTTTTFSLGAEVSLFSESPQEMFVDFVLGADVSAQAGFLQEIVANFVLSPQVAVFKESTLQVECTLELSTYAQIGLYSYIDPVCTFSFGTEITAASTKKCEISSQFVFGADVVITESLPVEIVANFALGINVAVMVPTLIDSVNCELRLGGSVDMFSYNQDFDIEAAFVLGVDMVSLMDIPGCSIPEYNSSRWA